MVTGQGCRNRRVHLGNDVIFLLAGQELCKAWGGAASRDHEGDSVAVWIRSS